MKYTDNAKSMNLRAELCARSGFSARRGVGSVSDLVKAAKEYGITALALCDEYSTLGYSKFYFSCRRENIDAIYGATIRINNTRVAILAKNEKGIAAINELISLSLPEDTAFNCSNKLEDFVNLKENVISIGILSDISNFDFIFNTFDYVGISPWDSPLIDGKLESKTLMYPNKFVVLSDSFYINKSDKLAFDALVGQTTKRYCNLKSGYDLLSDFEKEMVIDNPLKIISQIEDDAFGRVLGYLDTLDLIGRDEFITLVQNKVASNKLFENESYKNRLEMELNGIIKNGYWNIVYLAYRIVEEIKKAGEHCGFRGTMPNSMLNYALGITNVDPIKWGLPSEVAFGFQIDRVPDFDLNVSHDMRMKMFDIVEGIVGKGNVAMAGTCDFLTDKQITRLLDKHMSYCGYYDSEIMENAKIFRLEDTAVNYGMHPGGFIVKSTKSSFYEITPVKTLNFATVPTTLNDFHTIHDHFIKQDILEYSFFDFVKRVEKLTGINLDDVPLDDKEVLSLFEDDRALKKVKVINDDPNPLCGINEFTTRFMRDIVKATKPRTVEDLVVVMGLSHGTQVWNGNYQKLFEAGICSLSDVLANRDEIFTYLIYKGLPSKYAYVIMEDVRKGRGVKSDYAEVMKANGVPQYLIDSLDLIRYMFPRGHSVAYAINALKMAYYKVHYPAEFYTALFNAKYSEHLNGLLLLTPEEFERKVNENDFADGELSAIESLYEAMERGFEFSVDEKTSEAVFYKSKMDA